MLLKTLATGLDEAFLAWSVRPALPRLSVLRGLRSLAVAEQRTQREIADAVLFDAAQANEHVQATHLPGGGDEQEQQITSQLSLPAIARQWGFSGGPNELTTTVRRGGSDPRPLVILLSGWSPTLRTRAGLIWPLRQLDSAGFDVAIPALPWTRRVDGQTAVFPGNDPCANIVMTASIVSGLAQLVRYARSHQHPAIVVCATSLGAHLAALLATLPAAELVDGFILDKPLGQLSDLIRWHARGDSVWCHHVADRLQRVYRSVCPLDRRPKVAPERVTVIGAEFDRVTPMSAAQQVADHFQVELRPIKASHLFDPGRSSRLLQVLTEQRVRSASCE